MKSEFLKQLLAKAFPTILFLGSIFILYQFTDIFQPQAQIQPTTSPSTTPTGLPSEFPDYEAYKSMQSLVLAQDRESFSPKNAPIVGRLTRQLSVSGEFSRIYLYIEASVDSGKPLTQWDSIYLALNNVGGHLFRAQTLKVPGDTVTRLLFGLNQVPILTSVPYSENKTPTTVNWFALFKDGTTIKVDSFISSLRPGGKLNLLELRYECAPGKACEIR